MMYSCCHVQLEGDALPASPTSQTLNSDGDPSQGAHYLAVAWMIACMSTSVVVSLRYRMPIREGHATQSNAAGGLSLAGSAVDA